MIRALAEATLAFLVPFVLFGLVLLASGRNPLEREAWTKQFLLLVIAGLVCVILGFVLTGLLADRSTGAYEPAHMDNGRLVPGRIR